MCGFDGRAEGEMVLPTLRAEEEGKEGNSVDDWVDIWRMVGLTVLCRKLGLLLNNVGGLLKLLVLSDIEY